MARNRYLSPKEFGAVLADLRLTSNVFQDSLLEFLESQDILRPVARIHWPRALVVEARGGAASPTPAEREDAAVLEAALQAYRRHDADPQALHPLDLGPSAPGAALLAGPTGDGFQPWNEFRTNISGPGQTPRYVDDAVDTYYHRWQGLLAADALEMGARLVFDTRRQDLIHLAITGDFAAIPKDAINVQISLEGPRELARGLGWSSLFDAAAKVEDVYERKLLSLSLGGATKIEGAALADLQATHRRAALGALANAGAVETDVIGFLTYLAERWDDWTRRGRPEVANEYKRQIAFAARLGMQAFGIDFEALAVRVGRATGHFENTLDVIYPDWVRGAREKVELSLKHGVVAKAPSAEPALRLSDADIADFVAWLEVGGHWKLHHHIEQILERQFSGAVTDHAALAKEVESLATTFEHLINALLAAGGVDPAGSTATPRVRRLWQNVADVAALLAAHTSLVNTKSVPRRDRLAEIALISGSGANTEVAKLLLSSLLYRNDGLHNAMGGWTEDELHEVVRMMLTALMFSRKALVAHPPTPGPM